MVGVLKHVAPTNINNSEYKLTQQHYSKLQHETTEVNRKSNRRQNRRDLYEVKGTIKM